MYRSAQSEPLAISERLGVVGAMPGKFESLLEDLRTGQLADIATSIGAQGVSIVGLQEHIDEATRFLENRMLAIDSKLDFLIEAFNESRHNNGAADKEKGFGTPSTRCTSVAASPSGSADEEALEPSELGESLSTAKELFSDKANVSEVLFANQVYSPLVAIQEEIDVLSDASDASSTLIECERGMAILNEKIAPSSRGLGILQQQEAHCSLAI